MDRTSERRLDADAREGNLRIHLAALTRHALRQGRFGLTLAEARQEALRLYRLGLRASDC